MHPSICSGCTIYNYRKTVNRLRVHTPNVSPLCSISIQSIGYSLANNNNNGNFSMFGNSCNQKYLAT